MAEGAWFDNLTRALAGGGSRRNFLRVLGGSLVGALASTVLPPETEAAPASQTTCSPRPPVTVNVGATAEQLTVTVSATGTGNTLRRLAFGAIRNATVDVPGATPAARPRSPGAQVRPAAPVGSGATIQLPAGTSTVQLTVRPVDSAAAIHVPFVVTDACGDWPTFAGSGAGALQNPGVVCPSGETVLTAPADVGTTTLQVSNQGCFKVGEQIVLDPGGPNQEALDVVGFGSVLTRTAVQKGHAAGTRARPQSAIAPICARDADCSGAGEACCRAGAPHGFCCTPQRCCPDGCCEGIYNQCCRNSDDTAFCIESANPDDCCRQSDACPVGAPAGSQCCNFQDGQGRKCYPPSRFLTDTKHCGSCQNDCTFTSIGGGDRCVNGECHCGSGPRCQPGEECIRGICCKAPNVACGPSSNRVCCNAEVAYCSQAIDPSVCCLKERVACGTGCCFPGFICQNGTCVRCPCNSANSTDVQLNTCRCGNGPPCDTSRGQVCQNGACVCFGTTNPGDQLCNLRCTDNTQLNGTVCPAGQICCPDGLGGAFCNFGTTCAGDTPLTPICVQS